MCVADNGLVRVVQRGLIRRRRADKISSRFGPCAGDQLVATAHRSADRQG
jgi:hypothetical protein